VGKLTRVARTAAATITHLFEVDETATDPAGNAATVAFTDANGTAVTSGAGTRVSTGLYSFVLPGQASLAGLTAAWTGTIGGSTVTELDYVQIVGGYFFGLAEARADDSSLADTAKYTTADLLARRTEVEAECSEICDRAFVPEYRRRVVNGTGTNELLLTDGDIRTIRSVKVAPRRDQAFVALTTGQLAALDITDDSVLRRVDDNTWTEGWGNIVIEYEVGLDFPPPDLRRAAMTRLRSRLNLTKTSVPDRAISFTATDGGTYRLSTPAAYRTGIPEVDAAYARYSRRPEASSGTGGAPGTGRPAPASRQLGYDPQWQALFHGGQR
jgi:hypothetical protein